MGKRIANVRSIKAGDRKLSADAFNTVVKEVQHLARQGVSRPLGHTQLLVQCQAAISAGASGNVKLVYWTGAAFATYGPTITARNLGPANAPDDAVAMLIANDKQTPEFLYWNESSGASPDPGATITDVQKEGDQTAGASADYSRTDHAHQLLRRTKATSTAPHESGVEMTAEPDRIGVIWEADVGYIEEIQDTTGSAGSRCSVNFSDHHHAFDGTNFAGANISWVGGQFTGTAGPLSLYASTPELLENSAGGSAGASGAAARGDHAHPSTITGEANWEETGATAGKIYAVAK